MHERHFSGKRREEIISSLREIDFGRIMREINSEKIQRMIIKANSPGDNICRSMLNVLYSRRHLARLTIEMKIRVVVAK